MPATIVRLCRPCTPYIEQICVPKACQCRASPLQLDRTRVQEASVSEPRQTNGPTTSFSSCHASSKQFQLPVLKQTPPAAVRFTASTGADLWPLGVTGPGRRMRLECGEQ